MKTHLSIDSYGFIYPDIYLSTSDHASNQFLIFELPGLVLIGYSGILGAL